MSPLMIFQLRERFGTKVFAVFALFIVVISCCFTVLLLRHQTQSLTEGLTAQGELFVQLLAHSSRLGVFSENQDLLKDTIQGIVQNQEIVVAAVFNVDGKLLRESAKLAGRSCQSSDIDAQREIFQKLKQNFSPLCFERPSGLEFWAPVLSTVAYASEEELLLGRPEKNESHRTIGFAKIVIDKNILHKKLNRLLAEGVVIAAAFFLIGCLFAYFVAQHITRPLNSLTRGAQAIETGVSVEPIPVETRDEIGKLAMAFNSMAVSLRNREAEKQQLGEQLRHAQKMEAVGTLAGGIAHDFNNILQAIIGYGSLLKMKSGSDSALKHYVDLILSAADRAAQLTRGLLAFSRKQVINPKPSDLNELVKSIQKLLGHVIGEDIQVKVQFENSQLMVMMDPSQLDQVLMNLVTNARDAMPDGGTFTITTSFVKLDNDFFRGYSEPKPGNYAMIRCEDTGLGMDEKTKERIFDPFYTTKEVGKGTGLGLSTVYGIVKQHDGYIQVDSGRGAGTTFRIYFPLVDAKPERIERQELDEEEVGGVETVLVAEDDWAVRKLIRSILEEFGYRVIEAANGRDAVSRFADNKEDIGLMLFDVVLPNMSGKQAYEKILDIRSDVPVIFISGYPDRQISNPPSGSIPIVAKPISPSDLLKRVRQTLDK
jgi:signal transduction histidine kinase